MTIEVNTCLYCEQARPFTDEHILQAGFGTNWVLKEDVCGDCNSRVFGPLDDRLVKFARDFVNGHSIVTGMGHWFDEEAGIWWSVRLVPVNRIVTPRLLPQIVFLSPESLRIGGDQSAGTLEEQVRALAQELSNPQSLALSTKIVAPPTTPGRPAIQAAVVRSAPRTYFVRAETQREADTLLCRIKDGRLLDGRLLHEPTQHAALSGEQRSSAQPRVQVDRSVDLSKVSRAIAKSAVNLACACWGPRVVRVPDFALVRSFVYTGAGDPSSFVHWLWGSETGEQVKLFSRAGHHSAVLMLVDGAARAVFALYGQPFASVCLAQELTPGLLPDNPTVLALFDYQTRTHRVRRLADDPFAFAETLGLPISSDRS